MTWLVLTKHERPRKAVLLGRAVWRVNWATTVEDGQLRHTKPAAALRVVALDQTITTELTAAAFPPLGDGRAVPDFRTEASTNSYVTGELYRQVTSRNRLVEQVQKRWAIDDDLAVAARPRGAPSALTWLG